MPFTRVLLQRETQTTSCFVSLEYTAILYSPLNHIHLSKTVEHSQGMGTSLAEGTPFNYGRTVGQTVLFNLVELQPI